MRLETRGEIERDIEFRALNVHQMTTKADTAKPAKGGKAKCGYCDYMYKSPCEAPFRVWEDCFERAGAEKKDHKKACMRVQKLLRKCTRDDHPDYDWGD